MSANTNTAITWSMGPPKQLRGSRARFGSGVNPKCKVINLGPQRTMLNVESADTIVAPPPTVSESAKTSIFIDAYAKTCSAPSSEITRESEFEGIPFHVGMEIGGFRLTEVLAMGGLGVVYVAESVENTDEVVIVKVPIKDKEECAQIEEQGRLLKSLQPNPNIVKVLRYGNENGIEYCVMEKINGLTLTELLERRGRLSPQMVVGLALDICFALRAAHEKGITWRDIKPENIMLSRTSAEIYKAVLLDPMPDREKTNDDDGKTARGTPAWMSPEQCEEKEDPRSDFYSLGLVLYNSLTGKHPFNGRISLHRKLSETGYKKLPESQDIPSAFWPILKKLTAFESEARYQNLEHLVADLSDFQLSLPA